MHRKAPAPARSCGQARAHVVRGLCFFGMPRLVWLSLAPPPRRVPVPWGLIVAHTSFPLPAESAAPASGLEEAPGQTYGEAFALYEAPADTAPQVIMCILSLLRGEGVHNT